jgi:hypothetical protein
VQKQIAKRYALYFDVVQICKDYVVLSRDCAERGVHGLFETKGEAGGRFN